MSDTVRGLVLLTSVLLWLPFLPPVLEGSLTVEQGLLRYGGALLLAWGGGSGLSALVRSYAAQTELRAGTQPDEARQRRAEDRKALNEG